MNTTTTKDCLEDVTFTFLEELFQERHMAKMQIESFDHFLTTRLQKIIEEEPEIRVALNKKEYYQVFFGQVFVDKPYILDENRTVRYITPTEARIRELTYSSVVSLDVMARHVRFDPSDPDTPPVVLSEKSYHRLPICRMPMMVQSSLCNLYNLSREERLSSGECEFDQGGYFIIRGKERVIVAQERINYNVVYCFEPKQNSKTLIHSEIRSMSEETGHSVFIQMKLLQDLKMVMNVPYIASEIPVGYILRAYECTREEVDDFLGRLTRLAAREGADARRLQKCRSFCASLLSDYLSVADKEDVVRFMTQHAAYSVTRERRMGYIHQILYNEIFPHLGIASTRLQKIMFLLHMAERITLVLIEKIPMDDRDHVSNKRVETSGVLVGDLFRTLYKRMIRSVEPHLVKRPDISIILTRINSITLGLKHCFSTGNWGIPKSNYIRTGVSQVLSRLTFNATLSHLRRCLIPIGKEGKNTKIRQVHATQMGYICGHETPEGHSAGIVKNFAVSCRITNSFPAIVLQQVLQAMDGIVAITSMTKLMDLPADGYTKVMINGWWGHIVHHDKVEKIWAALHRCRKHGVLPAMVSLSRCEVLHEIHLFSDEGRMCRPLWNLSRIREELGGGPEKLVDILKTPQGRSLAFLEEKQWLVWVDTHEMENAVVATDLSCLSSAGGSGENRWNVYTHMEIHPFLIMGVCVGIIPYPDHTQSPRLCYQASMGKQAIGVYATTNTVRTDTIAHVLLNPERPVVHTHLSQWVGYNDIPSGNNLILAIACYSGFNQEDSVIINQSAIERGIFRSYAYRCVLIEEKKKSSNSVETIRLPPENIRNNGYNYSKLDPTGIILKGVYVGPGDILVGKVGERTHKNGQVDIVDQSVVVKNGEDGVVDTVFVSTSPDGYKMVKVKVRSLKIIETGDKVATRNGQKGTVGIVLKQEDMPFTASGLIPDIIMNPHAIPSRMTINQLLECVGAKSAVYRGEFRYCTAFTSHSKDIVGHLTDSLHDCGFQRHGNERLMNGMTGEMLEADVFIGPTYYQRLKHLVASKIHARNFGNVQTLFRQPCEGRSKDGGLRFGEMERDAMISHGVSRFLLERLYDMSDPFTMKVCNHCGMTPRTMDGCDVCVDDKRQLTTVQIPYACKLLFQELNAMGIRTQIFPSDTDIGVPKVVECVGANHDV